jgi:hypothetical protein
MSSSGFYISPTGNDKNPGTISAPFLTLAKAQQAMRAAPVADRTAYLLSGTYTITSPIALNSQDNGEIWTTYPGAPAHSAVLVNGSSNSKIFDMSSVQNLTFSNLTFDGGSSGGNAIFIDSNANNIHVQNNLFRNHFNGSDLWIYNSDNIYFQNNTSGPNELQPITGHVTDGKVHSGIFVTDNNISGFSRFGVELQTNSAGYFQNVHLDRNVVNITAGGGSVGNEVFSLVAGPSSVGNTVGGNKITGVRGDNQVFLELGTNNTSVENNSVTQIDHPIAFSSASGSEIESNTFTNDGQAFSRDGGYNDTQWVGVNTVNGVSQTGWSGVPNTTSKPVVWSASPIASVVASTVARDPAPTVARTSANAGGTAPHFNNDPYSDILWQNTSGQASIWEMNGTHVLGEANVGANPGPSWKAIGTGDFNGDGHADILWQNTNGQASIWEMNGTNVLGEANVGANPGPSWKAIGTGDFNDDGHSDILWQNTNGQAAIWEMNGTNVIGEANVGANLGPSWKAIGTGDYNGDGHSDILWQNTSGQAAIWEMNGTNVIGNSIVGANPGPSWHATRA